MRLTAWDPFRKMALLEREMNSLLRNTSPRSRGSYPPLTVVDEGDSVVVEAGLPGMNRDEIELTVLGDTLTIAGEKKLPVEEGATYIRHERPHGKFRRLIDLPYSVDHSNISASYTDGALIVKLHKAEEAKPKQITVE